MLASPHDGSMHLVFQHDHSLLAGRIASAWPEPFIAHGHRRGEVLEAVAHHDAGWAATDARGVLDPSTGRPASFLAMPPAAYPPIWSASIEEAARRGPLAEYLVARHCAALARMGRPPEADPQGRAALEAFSASVEETIARLARAIPPPPTSGPYPLAERALENDFRFLQLNDILSLAVCGGHAEPRLLGFLRAATVGAEPFHAELPGPFVLRVAPWVFEPKAIEETVAVRTILDGAYPNQAALTSAIAAASATDQPVRIEPL